MPRSHVTVRSGEQVVCEQCLVADRPLARMRGLLGRSDLPRGEGMLLRPAASIHTFFMRFSIDVVFLDRDGRVIDVAADVRPWRVAAAKAAASVMELPAGECSRVGLTVGDRVQFEPRFGLA